MPASQEPPGKTLRLWKRIFTKRNFNLLRPKPTRKRSSKLDGYKDLIDEWLEVDKNDSPGSAPYCVKGLLPFKEEDREFSRYYRLVAKYGAEKKKRTLYRQEKKFLYGP